MTPSTMEQEIKGMLCKDRAPTAAVAAFLMVVACSGAAGAQSGSVLMDPCLTNDSTLSPQSLAKGWEAPVDTIYLHTPPSYPRYDCQFGDEDRIVWKLIGYFNHLQRRSPGSTAAELRFSLPGTIKGDTCITSVKAKLSEYLETIKPEGCADGGGDACKLVNIVAQQIKQAASDNKSNSGIQIMLNGVQPVSQATGDGGRKKFKCRPRNPAPAVLRCGILRRGLNTSVESQLRYELTEIPAGSGYSATLSHVAADLVALHAALQAMPSNEPEPKIVLRGPGGPSKINVEKTKSALATTARGLKPHPDDPACREVGKDGLSPQCGAQILQASAWIERSGTEKDQQASGVEVELRVDGGVIAEWLNHVARQSAGPLCAEQFSAASLSQPMPDADPIPPARQERPMSVYFRYNSKKIDSGRCNGGTGPVDEAERAVCKMREELTQIVDRILAAPAHERLVVRVVGHSSRSADISYDQDLARDRARSVARYLSNSLGECALRNADCARARQRVRFATEQHASQEHDGTQGQLGGEARWRFQRADVYLEKDRPPQ